ncbi:MAG: serine/threonine-protein kinase, partial [Polyangiales bacterium]
MALASEISARGAHWARTDDDARSRARARALVCRRLFQEQSELLAVGPYELVCTLGRGGMGTVYEARDTRRDARFALKMLHGQRASALYHLKREFRALTAIRHPNLVALHELSTEGADAYFTMELIEGTDFVSHVRGDAPPGAPAPDLARLRDALRGLCTGIEALHAAGKLHRDLKPSNVLVTPAGRVVLLDFGLVHDAGEQCGEIAGTPAYMAPE